MLKQLHFLCWELKISISKLTKNVLNALSGSICKLTIVCKHWCFIMLDEPNLITMTASVVTRKWKVICII